MIKHVMSYLVIVVCLGGQGLFAEPIALVFDKSNPRISFTAGDIQSALTHEEYPSIVYDIKDIAASTNDTRIVLGEADSLVHELTAAGGSGPLVTQPQGYSIRVTRWGDYTTYWVLGADDVGAMYGGFELAESIMHNNGLTGIKAVEREPYISYRGIKFNIPLDARTPSYADMGHAPQLNIATVWDMDFWKELIDDLARYRYNVISLWNQHPFPSMIKMQDYPTVALDDVKRTTLPMTRLHEIYSTRQQGQVTEEVLNNLTTVKKMSIEDKITFWQQVMQYADDRGIQSYIFTWNVFVWGAEGKYGITANTDNEKTKEYYRQCVIELFETYPLLAGLGITAGENMPRITSEEKTKWLWDVYGLGMNEVVTNHSSDRNVRLIHRSHHTDVPTVIQQYGGFKGDLDFSVKYAGAHIYANTRPARTNKDFADLPADKRTWVELRNDDIFNFRWGDPEFVRTFIQSLPGKDKLTGFLMGSDGYVWGREFTSTEPDSPRELEIKKHWFRFMLWGRYGYDKDLSDDYFAREVEVRFPRVPNEPFMVAWKSASKVFPIITEFYWWNRDMEWAPEACLRRDGWLNFDGNFHTVVDFANHPRTQLGSGDMITISAYVDALRKNLPVRGTTPLRVADELDLHANNAMDALKDVGGFTEKNIRRTLGDIKCMALLGQYYADKIRGAVSYKLFDSGNKPSDKSDAIRHTTAAAVHWRQMADIAGSQYLPQYLARAGYLDWKGLTENVLNDIALVGGEAQFASTAPVSGGIILEAEDAVFTKFEKKPAAGGATGTGYLSLGQQAEGTITWVFNAEKAGVYQLDFRYALGSGDRPMVLSINNIAQEMPVHMWTTGGATVWMITSRYAQLSRGKNSISLTAAVAGAAVNLDHVNVLFNREVLFRGRLAFVNDGNNADADDIAAIPFQMAIVAAFAAVDKLVHVTYACDLRATSEQREQDLEASLKGAAALWGDFDMSAFFNFQNQQSQAIAHLRDRINESSSNNPLWIIEAGEPDVIGDALQAADQAKRQYVKIVTHHPHNDGGVYWHLTRTGRGRKSIAALPGMDPDFIVRIPDQNTELKKPESDYSWARDSSDPRIRFLWDRAMAAQAYPNNPHAGTVDPSDAGMVWYVLDGGPDGGGDETVSVADVEAKLTAWAAVNPIDKDNRNDGSSSDSYYRESKEGVVMDIEFVEPMNR